MLNVPHPKHLAWEGFLIPNSWGFWNVCISFTGCAFLFQKSNIWNILNPQAYAQNVFNFSFQARSMVHCLLCSTAVMPTWIQSVSHPRNFRNGHSHWHLPGLQGAVSSLLRVEQPQFSEDQCNQALSQTLLEFVCSADHVVSSNTQLTSEHGYGLY